ncbi:MAG TPA: class I SAM-dependent methyltransferase, partial [Thermoanaerobaculia bacterium]|nr:class I SAM-dependent methyltransferase [Thermoanaerobaculia bacterium]
DTARWVAFYRAMESERPDALFRDPWAKRLAGDRGAAIVRHIPRARAMAWALIVRTQVFDELILNAVQRDGADVVLNLAAGLDTRPYRLPLPPSLRWVEVDLPELLAHKERELAGESPVCELERVRLDLSDVEARRALFERVGGMGKRVLVASEGLLLYLTPQQVAPLAEDLHRPESFRWWITDLLSPALRERLHRRWGKHLKGASSLYEFAPEEGSGFFRPYGWGTAEFRPVFDEARRLKREMPMAWLLAWIGRRSFGNGAGVALLERA